MLPAGLCRAAQRDVRTQYADRAEEQTEAKDGADAPAGLTSLFTVPLSDGSDQPPQQDEATTEQSQQQQQQRAAEEEDADATSDAPAGLTSLFTIPLSDGSDQPPRQSDATTQQSQQDQEPVNGPAQSASAFTSTGMTGLFNVPLSDDSDQPPKQPTGAGRNHDHPPCLRMPCWLSYIRWVQAAWQSKSPASRHARRGHSSLHTSYLAAQTAPGTKFLQANDTRVCSACSTPRMSARVA